MSSHCFNLCSVLFLIYALYDSVQVLSLVLIGDSDGLDQLVLLSVISSNSYLLVCLLNVALWLDIELVLTAR